MEKINEFRKASYLHKVLFEGSPEGELDTMPIEVRMALLQEWDFMRKKEKIGLANKAKMLETVINLSFLLAALAGIAMLIINLLSNGSTGYDRAIFAFGVQMFVMLAICLVFSAWRCLWSLKLDKLALTIPIKYHKRKIFKR